MPHGHPYVHGGFIAGGAESELFLKDGVQVLFVGKHGNDAEDGRDWNAAKLTITAAIAQATADGPPTADLRWRIEIVDGGTYTEDFTIPTGVDVVGLAATVSGNVILSDDSSYTIGYHFCDDGNAVSKTGGSGTAYFDCYRLTCEGDAIGVRNLPSDGVVMARIWQLYVETGIGIGDQATGEGHLHVEIEGIYLTGTGIGLARNQTGSIVGTIHHIKNEGGGAGTAILVANGEMDLDVGVIDTTTAWNVGANGTLNLYCGNVTGTHTLAGTLQLNGWTAGDAVCYVGKGGNDNDPGNNPDTRKLTIGSAITLVDAAGGGQVHVIDGDSYTENLSIPEGVHVYGPNCTIVGAIVLEDDAGCWIGEQEAATGLSAVSRAAGSTGVAYYRARTLTCAGTANALVNQRDDATLVSHVDVIYIETGIGVYVVGGSTAIHNVWIGNIVFTGDAEAVKNNGGFIYGTIQHVLGLELGGGDFQPAEHVDGATVVSNNTELQAAAASASDGDRIEIDTAGSYKGVQVSINLTIAATVTGVDFSVGTGEYFEQNGSGKTLTLIALTGTTSDANNGMLRAADGVIRVYRCWFDSTVGRISVQSTIGGEVGDIEGYGSIFEGSAYTGANNISVFSLDGSGLELTLRNCIVYGPQGTGTQYCIDNYQGTLNLYNNGFREGNSGTIDSTGGVMVVNDDYNAMTDNPGVMTGANNDVNITWGNYYNATYDPLNTAAESGGSVAQAADEDYYGNDLDVFAPMGAKTTEIGYGLAIDQNGGDTDLYINRINQVDTAYDVSDGELHLHIQEIAGTRTDSADGAYVHLAGKYQSHVETVTSASDIELDLETLPFKYIDLSHDATFTLANQEADINKCISVKIENDSGSDHTFSFPAGWYWATAEPAGLDDGDIGLLSIESWGANDSDVVASYELLAT